MRVRVLVAEVVHVVGGHGAKACLLRELPLLWQQRALLGQAGVLQLDEDVLGAEQVRQAADLGHGAVLVAVPEQHGDAAAHAPGEGDEALAVLGEQVPVGARLVVVAFEVGACAELDQVLVAGLVTSQQREVRVALLDSGTRVAIGGHVQLEADDGLDALPARGVVELDHAAQRAVVGERDGGHAELLGPLDEALRHGRRRRAASIRCARADGRSRRPWRPSILASRAAARAMSHVDRLLAHRGLAPPPPRRLRA